MLLAITQYSPMDDITTTEEPLYSWTQLGKGRMTEPLHPDMLTPEGYETLSGALFPGEPNDKSSRKPKRILYDRHYAICKAASFFKRLHHGSSRADLEEFWNDLTTYLEAEKNKEKTKKTPIPIQR